MSKRVFLFATWKINTSESTYEMIEDRACLNQISPMWNVDKFCTGPSCSEFIPTIKWWIQYETIRTIFGRYGTAAKFDFEEFLKFSGTLIITN